MLSALRSSLGVMVTNQGRSVLDASNEHPVLLVFLRHFGCTFCREALMDLARERPRIQAEGSRIIFVHMASNQIADNYFERHKLRGAEHVSDPSCQYYKAFGLTKGTPRQLFGLQSWIRGFEAGVIKGLGVGPQLGDGFQMPGVFAITNGEVKASFIHKLASDRPEYLNLVKECCSL